MSITTISLQSGSSGNCIYVQAGGVRLLLDAGISGIAAQRRLAAAGHDIRQVDAVLISHDHCDHVRNAGVFHRKFGLPVYATEKTWRAACRSCRLGPVEDVRHFAAGRAIRVKDLTIETVPTPHDGAEGVAFVVDDGRSRVGVLTDLGHVFQGLRDAMSSVDGVMLESNYDPEMLRNGPYPYFLQQRIIGPGGHLSNFEAAEALAALGGGRLKWACLAHLSEHNNEPALARRTHERIARPTFPLFVASRYEATVLPEV